MIEDTNPAALGGHSLRELVRHWWWVIRKKWVGSVICRFKGHNFDDSEQGHLIGSQTHDQWCKRCDHFRGIPCAEHPKYDS